MTYGSPLFISLCAEQIPYTVAYEMMSVKKPYWKF